MACARCVFILALLAIALMLCDRSSPRYPWLGVSPDGEVDRLMTAIELRDESVLRQLLSAHAVDLRSRDSQGLTALGRAAREGWLGGCQLLLDRTGVDPNALDGLELAPLHYAVILGRPEAREVADLLIRHGARVDVCEYRQTTPLHTAALFGREDVLQRLLRASHDVNAAGEDGCTPLHDAAIAGSAEKVSLLLRWGADPRRVNSQGDTPADIAREQGSKAVQDALARFAPPVW